MSSSHSRWERERAQLQPGNIWLVLSWMLDRLAIFSQWEFLANKVCQAKSYRVTGVCMVIWDFIMQVYAKMNYNCTRDTELEYTQPSQNKKQQKKRSWVQVHQGNLQRHLATCVRIDKDHKIIYPWKRCTVVILTGNGCHQNGPRQVYIAQRGIHCKDFLLT